MDRCITTVHGGGLGGSVGHRRLVAVMEPEKGVNPNLMGFPEKEVVSENTLANEKQEVLLISGHLTISF